MCQTTCALWIRSKQTADIADNPLCLRPIVIIYVPGWLCCCLGRVDIKQTWPLHVHARGRYPDTVTQKHLFCYNLSDSRWG